jgi:hypothetical protein
MFSCSGLIETLHGTSIALLHCYLQYEVPACYTAESAAVAAVRVELLLRHGLLHLQ